ncbi:MAG: fdsC [Burkholderiaceae bacterium]|nr:fdsC [Burkholderiaceae bacterium]
MPPIETSATVAVTKWRAGQTTSTHDQVAEEVPVALEYNGISHAVMLATPNDLEDFALGFSLTEGILAVPSELYSCEISGDLDGIRIELEIASERFFSLKEKRRSLTGRTGCGLCGTETLPQAIRIPPPVVSTAAFSADTLHAAFRQMEQQQLLQQRTGATHAAAWLATDGQVTLVREDVGRHNALDKLIGALRRGGIDTATGAAIVTSRASYEMVQKAASAGIGILAAVSAPTALAVRIADITGLTLAGFVRQQGHAIYTHPQRLMA